MVVAADDVRNAHQRIVHNGREIVGRRVIRAENNEIIELRGIKFNITVNNIVHGDNTSIIRHFDTNRVGNARIYACFRFFGIDSATCSLIALKAIFARLSFFARTLELFWRAETIVGFTLVYKLLSCCFVEIKTLCLPIGAKVAAFFGSFIPVETKPAHCPQNDLSVFVS